MKALTKLFVAIATLIASASFVSCKDIIITVDKLPADAQSFIKEFFADKTVSYVKKDRELTRTNYEVVFQDGTEVEFNGKGQWHSIDCKRAAVPAALIPAAISEYVRQGFPGQDIVKIDKETYGHEIKFASGLELKFSKNGKLVNVDD
jgi:hypothetical protein